MGTFLSIPSYLNTHSTPGCSESYAGTAEIVALERAKSGAWEVKLQSQVPNAALEFGGNFQCAQRCRA